MTKSLEHIVPLALGGSNQFTTLDTSTKYNSVLGTSIDAPFMNQPLLAILRHTLALTGHSGTIPPIEWEGRSMDNSEPISILISHDGTVSYRMQTNVIDDKHEKYVHRLVAGSPEVLRPIFAGMLKKAKAKGDRIYTQEGKQLATVQDMEDAAEVEITDLVHFQINPIDPDIWVRGIAKIALGLCHIVLGEEWTFSTDGDRLRAILFLPRDQWPTQTLKGMFAHSLPPELEQLLGITPAVRAAQCHTLAVIPTERPRAIISLFGGDAIFEPVIELGSERGLLTPHNVLSDPPVGVRIYPQIRKVELIRPSTDLMRAVPSGG